MYYFVNAVEPLHFVRSADDVFAKKGDTAIFSCIFTKPHVKVQDKQMTLETVLH